MGKFTRVNINKELANSFTEVFNDRLETPTPKKPSENFKLVEPNEKLTLIEWKNYIRNELKKFV
jgi:hypothetical protein